MITVGGSLYQSRERILQQLMTLSTKCISALVLCYSSRKQGFHEYMVFESKTNEQNHAANTVP